MKLIFVVVLVQSVNNGLFPSVYKKDSDPLSTSFDLSIFLNIFAFACVGSPQDFKRCTLICRNWREIVSSEIFYQELIQRIAPHIFGRADYKKYIGGDSGEELPIPLEYLVNFRPGETLLTFSPKELAFTQADETVVVEPRTMVNMGKWALNAKEGHSIGNDPELYQPAIVETRDPEESHWSFIDIKLIEKNKTFAEQERAVLARGEALVGLRDLSLSLLMTYVKTGVRHLNWGETNTNHQWARLPETTQRLRLCVGFAAAGLFVLDLPSYDQSDIGVVVARQSFGH